MDGNDAATEVLIGYLAETSVPKDLAEPFLIWKRTDRRRQVFVDAGAVAREPECGCECARFENPVRRPPGGTEVPA